MIDANKIEEIKQIITQKYDPEKIILFGSYANNTATDDSDLDLLIIKDTDQNPVKRGMDVRKLLRGVRVPVDILVYTPTELDELGKIHRSLEEKITRTGKTIYVKT